MCLVGKDCSPGRLRRGMCERHYRRFMSTGSTDSPWLDNLTNYWIVEDGCWLWLGGMWPNGYGKTSVEIHGTRLAHRAFYAEAGNDVPEGMDLDHLCRVRLCVNPDHLEPVTRQENVIRGLKARTVCQNEHDLTLTGAFVPGTHQCRECRLAKFRRANARRRMKAR